jgi:hypothetical protein
VSSVVCVACVLTLSFACRRAERQAHRSVVIETQRAPATYAGCEEHPVPQCDLVDVACARRLFALVACMYGTKTASMPPVRFVEPSTLHAAMTAFREQEESERGALEAAATTLGLMAPREPPRPDDASGPSAFYSTEQRAVLFVKRPTFDTKSEYALFVLGHEFVHALQDRDSALARVQAGRDSRTFDGELALRAAIEGEATLYEEILRALVRRQPLRAWLPRRLGPRTDASDDDGARYRRLLDSAFISFPYAYGGNWAAVEWLEHGTFLANARGLPDVTTRFVMAKRYGWPELKLPCNGRSAGASSAAQQVRVVESLGAWMTQAFVRQATHDATLAREAAEGLGGDELAVSSDRVKPGSSFTWTTCWASEALAERFEPVLRERLGALGTPRFVTTRRGNAVIARIGAL